MTFRVVAGSTVLGLSVLAGACTTPAIPAGYTGPTATVRDSFVREAGSRSQFYFVSQIDGRRVDNTLLVSRQGRSGRGFTPAPVPFQRDIPARATTLDLGARIDYGETAQEIYSAEPVYTARRTLRFTPEAGKAYVIKGELTAAGQDVWLEDESGRRVGGGAAVTEPR